MFSLLLTVHFQVHTLGTVGSRHSGVREAVWGFSALLKGLTSVVDNSCQSRDSNPQPRVTSPTLYPLGHEISLPPLLQDYIVKWLKMSMSDLQIFEIFFFWEYYMSGRAIQSSLIQVLQHLYTFNAFKVLSAIPGGTIGVSQRGKCLSGTVLQLMGFYPRRKCVKS